MKKLLAILLSAVLSIGLMSCGADAAATPATDSAPEKVEEATTETTTEATTEAAAPATEGKKLKIGYTFWDLPVAGICIDGANQIKLAAEALGVDLVFNPNNDDISAESVVAAVENFAASGCDGVIVINFSEASLVTISQICQENEMMFIQATRTINDEEVAKVVEANPYYVGRFHEDEYGTAYSLAEELSKTGAKNVAMISSYHGDTAYEARAQAYRDACKDLGMNLVVEQWDLPDDATATETLVNMLTAYPEIDGILAVKSNYVTYLVTAEETVGITDYLPVVGVDFDTTLGENIEKGQITAVAGGHHADATFALITLVNALNGAYDQADFPLDIENAMMKISGPEEYADYLKWCIGYDEDFYHRQNLNTEEIQNLCVLFNPDTKIEDIAEMAGNMSLEDVKKRHAGTF
ncbi:ABC-type sugar transport system, substrate-binding protein, contains N-terminal xre family HTH domain [Lachnospiraceae bacterium G11]|nr:ABC-type sugar transport system, substrate-binding protein, contains N-terminal xre family HTH domain [Lachnospiraceae bacterium G11]